MKYAKYLIIELLTFFSQEQTSDWLLSKSYNITRVFSRIAYSTVLYFKLQDTVHRYNVDNNAVLYIVQYCLTAIVHYCSTYNVQYCSSVQITILQYCTVGIISNRRSKLWELVGGVLWHTTNWNTSITINLGGRDASPFD